MKKCLRHYFVKLASCLAVCLVSLSVQAQVPTITGFNPQSGPVGTDVTITGSNFDANPALDVVLFGSAVGKVKSVAADGSSLVVTVPVGADLTGITVTNLSSKLSGASQKGFDITFSSNGQIDFGNTVQTPVGSLQTIKIVCDDLNEDGKMDLIMLDTHNANAPVAIFYLNTSVGNNVTFDNSFNIMLPLSTNSISTADLDGDGKKDLVMSEGQFQFHYAINQTSPQSQSLSFGNLFLGVFPNAQGNIVNTSLLTKDLNADGKNDLIFITDNSVHITPNTSANGTVNFGSNNEISIGFNIKKVQAQDLDDDGKPELVISFDDGAGNTGLMIYKNMTASPGDVPSFSFYTDMVAGVNFAIGDINQDGKPDLLLPNQSGKVSRISVLLNNGNLTFRPPFHITTSGGVATDVFLSDVDGNGLIDLVTENKTNNYALVLQNMGAINGHLDFKPFNVGTNLAQIALKVADIDGDGKPDLVVADNNFKQLSIYLNTTPTIYPPTIISMNPSSGKVGDDIVITGENFSTDKLQNAVYFGATQAVVKAATSTSLTVTVPAGANNELLTVTNVGNGLTAYSLKPFGLTFANGAGASFGIPKKYNNVGLNPSSIALGDVNGDGFPDLVTTDLSTNELSLSINDGAGDFSIRLPILFSAAFTDATYVKLGDLDGDGKLDIAVSDTQYNLIYVFHNNGDKNKNYFDAPTSYAASSPGKLVIADMDRDGKSDIVVVNKASNSFSVFRNISDVGLINFNPKQEFNVSVSGYNGNAIAVGDLDEDGITDVVLGMYNGQKAYIFHNSSIPGTFKFTESSILNQNFSTTNDITIGDMNGDLKSDIVLSGGQQVVIYLNTNTSSGTASFIEKSIIRNNNNVLHPIIGLQVKLSDLNGDGLLDILASNGNTSKTSSVAYNTTINGQLDFADPVNYFLPPSGISNSLAVGDLDNDGRPDFVLTDYGNNPGQIAVFKNKVYSAPPTIISMNPSSGKVGDDIVITGENFSTDKLQNAVYFGATQAVVKAATSTSLTVTVPAGANNELLTVTNVGNGLTAYSLKPFGLTFANGAGASFGIPKKYNNVGLNPSSIALGDVNGDGFPDLVTTDLSTNELSLSINDGAGDFSIRLPILFSAAFTDATYVKLGDLDGDGKLDIAVSDTQYNLIYVFHNNGDKNKNYFDAPTSYAASSPGKLVIADMDRDGKSDIVVVNKASNSFSVFRNISDVGLINFNPKQEFNVSVSGYNGNAIAVGDLDEDGITDVVLGMYNGQKAYIFHNSSIPGTFKFTESSILNQNFSTTNDITIGDMNGDLKSDIVLSGGQQVVIYLNTNTSSGTASFIEKSIIRNNNNVLHPIIGLQVKLSDLNGDGLLDILASNGNTSKTSSVAYNTTINGQLDFADPVNYFLPPSGISNSLAVGDLDNDGRPDFVLTDYGNNPGQIAVFKNIFPIPTITSFSPHFGPVGTQVTIKGKGFNLTPDQNIVFFGGVMAKVEKVISSNELIVSVPLGTDNGFLSLTNLGSNLTAGSTDAFDVTFTAAPQVSFGVPTNILMGNGTGKPVAVASKDLNGDGLIDLVVANLSNAVSVFINKSTTGNASFDAPIVLTTGQTPESVKIADIDNDGLQDIVVTTSGVNKINVFHNTTSKITKVPVMSFAASQNFDTGTSPKQLEIADFDGDGKFDLIVANTGGAGSVSILKNTSVPGTISFDAHADTFVDPNPLGLAIGDLNGDGKLDVATTSNSVNRVTLLKNTSDATGISFAGKTYAPTANIGTNALVITDVNGDGKKDLAYTDNTNIAGFSVQLGNGDMSFQPEAKTSSGNTPGMHGLSAGDVDGDGIVDIALIGNDAVDALRIQAILKNITDGFFATVYNTPTEKSNFTALEDVDNDGKLDYITALSSTDAISIRLNTTVTPIDIETLPATNIIADGARLNGKVRANVSDVTVTFEYSNQADMSTYLTFNASANATVQVGAGFKDSYFDANNMYPGILYYRVVGTNTANKVAKGAILSVDIPAVVLSITATSPNPVLPPLGTVDYKVTFSGEIDGLTASNFSLTSTGSVSGAAVIDVKKDQSDPKSWLVVVNLGVGGDGTLTMNLANTVGLTSFNGANGPVTINTVLPLAGDTYTIDAGAPSAPTGLVANAGDAQIKLNWVANPESDLATYEIYGGTSANPTTLITSVQKGTLTYTDVNLTNGTTYYYRITAKDASGNESPYSNEVSATPQAGQAQTVSIPQGLSANPGDAVVKLDWLANTEATLAGYEVYGGTSANPTTLLTTVPVGSTTYTDANLSNGTTYYYRIVAKLTDGSTSGYSNEVSATPQAGQAQTVSIPQGLSANPGDAVVKLDWLANTEANLAGYEVYGGTSANPTTLLTNVQAGTQTYTDANLSNGTTYYYRIVAKLTDGSTSGYSNEVSATPQAGQAQTVSIPQGLSANPGDAVVKLDWLANTEATLAGYEVYGGTSANPTTLLTTVPVGSTTYTDANLSNGTTYYYRIVAKLADGSTSGYSNEVSAIPKAGQVMKIDQTINFTPLTDKMYGDADFDIANLGTSTSGLQVVYSSSDNSIATVNGSVVHILKAGTVSIHADQSGNGTYNAAGRVSRELLILPYPITIQADLKTKVENTPDPVLTYTITPPLLNGDVVSGSLVRTPGETAGIYAITQGSLSVSDNYKLTFINNQLVITAAPLNMQTITFNALPAKTYGDADFDAGAVSSAGLAISYSSSDNSIATIVNGKVHILKAGTVTIYADQAGNGQYPAAAQASQILTINKVDLQVSANAKTKVYGTNDPTFTYILTSGTLLAGDALSGTLNRAPGENVGAYAIGLGSLTAGANYSLTVAPANLTITPAAITVSANPVTKNIGDADPLLTYTYTPSLIGTDVFTGSLDRSPGEGVGVYAIGQGSLTAGNNYTLNFVPSSLTIKLKSASAFKLDANNILTPNGDGKNDKLVIKGLDQYPPAKVTIVDREGRVVYQSNHYQDGFDGTYNGKPLSDNTYYYIVDFGKEFGRIKGFITIIN
ncbi:FG-GAP-like repeat-containing protein [Pedobacter sp. UC225_61]|uniref:FG-GAP-like repeat-containing protein n=1 Tax=Pedobacter sp. UC225_61 TaxID=3374623 RepID=UPI00378BF834